VSWLAPTPTEFRLLTALAAHAEMVISREQLTHAHDGTTAASMAAWQHGMR
jgi:DNA-binding response OmpR family regulator